MSASAAARASAEQTQPLLGPAATEEGLQQQQGQYGQVDQQEARIVERETESGSTPWRVLRSNNMSGSAWVVQVSCMLGGLGCPSTESLVADAVWRPCYSLPKIFGLAFVALVWSLVFSKMPWDNLPLFGYHPLLQVRLLSDMKSGDSMRLN